MALLRRKCATADAPRKPGEFRVAGCVMAEEVVRKLWIGQLQKRRERAPLGSVRPAVSGARVALEQDVELLHAAPATPQHTPPVEFRRCTLRLQSRIHVWRSTSIFLISAMAFAG